jgi:response regulator NasT
MAELLAANLARLGHRVVGVASNGMEAIELALETRPDVVIMDIQMPVLDGLEAAAQILAQHRIPIVLSTGLSDARTLNRAADLNVISFLVKPFSPAQLKVALHLAIAQCRGSRGTGQ